MSFLGVLGRGNVSRDLGGTKNLARRILHRRHRQRDMDETAILAPSHRVEMLDLLAGAQLPDDRFFFVKPILGDDDRDRAADRLVSGKAKKLLGPGIPAHDDAIKGLREDRVVAVLDNRSQPGVRFKGFLPATRLSSGALGKACLQI